MEYRHGTSRLIVLPAIVISGLLLAFTIRQETPVGALKGVAIAQETGSPLQAYVALQTIVPEGRDSTSYDTESAKDGSFSFPRLPVGDYMLTVTSKSQLHTMDPVRIRIEEGETRNIEAELSAVSPSLDLFIHQHVFTPDERPQITCRGLAQADSLSVRLYRVDLNAFLLESNGDLSDLLGVGSYYGDSGTESSTSLDENRAVKLTHSMPIPITTRDLEGVFTQRVDLPQLDPGLYVASITADSLQKLGWIMVTSLGLITKSVGANVLAHTVDLKTGQPVAGADVTAYVGSDVAGSGKSGADGTVNLHLSPKDKGEDRQTVVAHSGPSFAFVSGYFSSTGQSRRLFYVYTDRPVYRPGQRVYYKGIARDSSPGGYKVPTSLPVTVEVRDAADTLIYRAVRRTDRFGSYSGYLDLNPETATGSYTLVSNVEGQGRGEAISFQVSAYRKPEFSVKVTFPRKRYVRGDTIRAHVAATYYFGAPVANAKVTYYIRRVSYWPDWMSDIPDEETDSEGDYGYSDSGYEDYGGYGELVEEGSARTDSNGEAEIEFPGDWPQPDEQDAYDSDQEFSVEVYVGDVGNSEATGTGSVIVTRGEFAIDVAPDRYVVEPGQATDLSLRAMDYDRHPMANRRITLKIDRERWTTNKIVLEPLARLETTTDRNGRARVPITIGKSGEIRVTAQSRDDRGNTIISTAYVFSYGGASEYDDRTHLADLEVVTDKKTYDPGDVARVLISTRNPGATALVTVEGDRIYESRVIRLTGKSTLVEVPVRSEYRPNFYVGVCFVKNKTLASQVVRAKVTLGTQALNVRIRPSKAKYRPGESAVYNVRVTDANGKPARAQLSIGVVDEAIYAIAPDSTPQMLDFFYARKPNRVTTGFSFPEIYLSDPDKAGSPIPNKPNVNVRLRKRFMDTAYWVPGVETNAKGEAAVRFRLPDNLTTWRTTVRGITTGTACGEARNTVIAQQEFMVRLEMPRFLVQNDESVLTAIVHNYTGRDQDVEIQLRAPGLRVDGSTRRSVSVRGGGVERVGWSVRGRTPGLFDIAVRAVGDRVGDAVQLSLPVYPHGVRREARTAGALRGPGSHVLNIQVRRDSIPAATHLTIRLAPSLAGAMLGSLDYLAQYPYGCTEQTTSSFIPDVILSRSLTALGMRNARLEAELPDMVANGMFRLYRFQLEDGGWSWCTYGASDPWMTAYVCYGLIQARQAGFPVNSQVLIRGVNRLTEQLSRGKMDVNTTAYVCYVLSLAGYASNAQISRLVARSDLSSQALALITLTYAQLGNRDGADAALRRLFGRAVSEPGMIHWTDSSGWEGDDVEATALGLQAVLKVNSGDPRSYDIVQWLMRRRSGDYWYSTRDTAMVLYAMSEFFKVSKELSPDMNLAVVVNGKTVATTRFSRASIFEPEFQVSIPGSGLRKGRNSLEIRRTGAGNVYYTTELVQYLARDVIPSAVTGSGLTITREYFRPPTSYYDDYSEDKLGRQVSGGRTGDIILVRLKVDATTTVRRLLVEDYIPAGCEIVDRGNLPVWEWSNWWVGQDVRDEKISFYVDELKPGEHRLEYQMRVGFGGTYHALPAQVFAMYSPTVRASTDEREFTVR